MKKVNSIQLTEKQTKRAIRLLKDLYLYYNLHCEGGETKEELKVINQTDNLIKLLKLKLHNFQISKFRHTTNAERSQLRKQYIKYEL